MNRARSSRSVGSPRDLTSIRRTRIKICGITSIEEADAAIVAGADAIGLVFTASSPRSVLPHTAMQIARRVPPFVSVVGVFSNPSDPDLMAWSGRWVQLQGQEDEPQIQRVARHRSIIKAFPLDGSQLRRWDRCPNVGALLVQLPESATAHGDSSAIAHDIAQASSGAATPIILGGSLPSDHMVELIRITRPHAVDLSVTAGDSDRNPSMIRSFCVAVREADAASI